MKEAPHGLAQGAWCGVGGAPTLGCTGAVTVTRVGWKVHSTSSAFSRSARCSSNAASRAALCSLMRCSSPSLSCTPHFTLQEMYLYLCSGMHRSSSLEPAGPRLLPEYQPVRLSCQHLSSHRVRRSARLHGLELALKQSHRRTAELGISIFGSVRTVLPVSYKLAGPHHWTLALGLKWGRGPPADIPRTLQYGGATSLDTGTHFGVAGRRAGRGRTSHGQGRCYQSTTLWFGYISKNRDLFRSGRATLTAGSRFSWPGPAEVGGRAVRRGRKVHSASMRASASAAIASRLSRRRSLLVSSHSRDPPCNHNHPPLHFTSPV